MLLMIRVDLRPLRHFPVPLERKLRTGRKGELLRRRSTLRLDLEILYRKAQLLTTLGTVAAKTLYCLTRRLQLYSSIERFATLCANDPLRRQKPAKASLNVSSQIRY